MRIKDLVRVTKEFIKTLKLFSPQETREKEPKCIVSAYDLRRPERLEEKLLGSGFDLNGWVEITEIKEGSVWIYHQTPPPETLTLSPRTSQA